MFAKMLLNSLFRRGSRMAVALLAVAIGATTLLGMAAISYDIPRQMGREFRSYGANMIIVPSGENQMFDLKRLDAVRALIPGDELVGMTPQRFDTVRINMRGYTAVGIDFDGARLTSPYWSIEGNWPDGPDDILIGLDIAESTRLRPGAEVEITGRRIDGARFRSDARVSGVVRTGSAEDEFIFLRLATMMELTGDPGSVGVAEVSVAAGEAELSAIAARITEEIPELTARLVKRVTQSETAVLSKLRSLVLLASIVVLALSMICVAATMMAVVMERRAEIGLKKAIGAGDKAIALEFLCEGILLGCVGGVIGSAMGYLFAQTVCVSVFGRSVSLAWSLFPLTVFVSTVVTAASCLIPARRAMEVEPALVLRGE
jgi:putative ABC transport system permease protein